MKTISIKVKQSIKGNVVNLTARRPDKKNINIVSFFKPYQAQGMILKKLTYINNEGYLTAILHINPKIIEA